MNILAITCMRNEGPHCLEWIAHHMAAGIGHFLIYTNDCDDGTDLLLDCLQQAGIVTHIRQESGGDHPVQWQALNAARSHPKADWADWVLVSDCDEFINLRPPVLTLQEMIELLPGDTDAVAMPWRLFGNARLMEFRDALTIGQFCHAAPESINLPLAHFFKSLFRPGAFRQYGVHRPKRKKDRIPVWVDGSGKKLPENVASADHRINLFGVACGSDLVQLNHYSLRSTESFMVKRSRGLPNHTGRVIGLAYWVERNFNTVADKTILAMQSQTSEKLTELLRIDGLQQLHDTAVLWHKSKFTKMMKDQENLQLFWRLVLAGDSQAPGSDAVVDHLERIKKSSL